MSEERTARPRAVVAGHGDFPAGIVHAVEQITGRGRMFAVFSSAGMGREEIEAGLRRSVESDGVRVVFTDVPGGSATVAARRVARDHPDMVVVCGTNLATLLDFAVCDDSLAAQDAARRAAERGRAAVSVLTG